MKNCLYIFLFIFCLSSCASYSEEAKTDFNKKALQLAKKKGLHVTQLESGLLFEQIEEGTGEDQIQAGSIVKLVYNGKLANGSIFDNTNPRTPFESKLNGLIMGFQEGLLGQKKGAKIRLVIPPHMGYGDKSLDKIPSNSILFFEIEVIDVL